MASWRWHPLQRVSTRWLAALWGGIKATTECLKESASADELHELVVLLGALAAALADYEAEAEAPGGRSLRRRWRRLRERSNTTPLRSALARYATNFEAPDMLAASLSRATNSTGSEIRRP